jgi:hypothetical protein
MKFSLFSFKSGKRKEEPIRYKTHHKVYIDVVAECESCKTTNALLRHIHKEQHRIIGMLRASAEKETQLSLDLNALEANITTLTGVVDEVQAILASNQTAQEKIDALAAQVGTENTDLRAAIDSLNPAVPGGAVDNTGGDLSDVPAGTEEAPQG